MYGCFEINAQLGTPIWVQSNPTDRPSYTSYWVLLVILRHIEYYWGSYTELYWLYYVILNTTEIVIPSSTDLVTTSSAKLVIPGSTQFRSEDEINKKITKTYKNSSKEEQEDP